MYSKPVGVQAALLPGQVREVLGRDRRHPGVVALPRLGHAAAGPARCPRGTGSATRSPSASPPARAGGTGTTTRCCTSAARRSAGSSSPSARSSRLASSSLRSGMSSPRSRCQSTTASLSVRSHVVPGQDGVGRQLDVRRRPLGDPRRRRRGPSRPCRRSSRAGSGARTRGTASGRTSRPWPGSGRGSRSCGCVSSTWYCSTNASSASFQLTGSRNGVPPLGAHRLELPRVHDRGERLDAVPQRWRARVEVDPGAAAPQSRTAPARGRCRRAAGCARRTSAAAGRRCSCRRVP